MNKNDLMVQEMAVRIGCIVLGYTDAAPQIDRMNEEDEVKFALIDLIAQRPAALQEIVERNQVPESAKGLVGEEFQNALKPLHEKMRKEVLEAGKLCQVRVAESVKRILAGMPMHNTTDPTKLN